MIAALTTILPILAVCLFLFTLILSVIFKQGKMNANAERLCKISIYVILNLLLLLTLLWSLTIYTSTFKGSPWYEPCGMQFLCILIFSDPAFLAVGVALLILSKYYRISRFNKLLPFIAIIGLSVPLFGPLNKGIVIGLPINVGLCVLVIVATAMNLIQNREG